MLIITPVKDLLFICHFSMGNVSVQFCLFHIDFLPGKTVQHILKLRLSETGQHQPYLLNARQDKELEMIFEKLIEEKKSTYTFSDTLQKTYLIEMIHLITKISQGKIPRQALLN
jgi:hypothetical protein